MSPLKIAGLEVTYCQYSVEVAPRWMISALEMLAQISAKISYCESRAVIGEGTVAIVVAVSTGFRENLWCALGGISRGKMGLRFRRKLMICACVAVRMRI
jgi:hypothetical protein